MKRALYKSLMLLIVLFSAGSLKAEEVAGKTAPEIIQLPRIFWEPVFWLSALIIVLLLASLLVLVYTMMKLIRVLSPKDAVSAETSSAANTIFKTVQSSWTEPSSPEKEKELLLDHEYDGIHELDNNLPTWWRWMFYVTIIFSVIYLIRYHVIKSGDLQLDEYKKELVKAEEEKAERAKNGAAAIDENNVTLLTEAADLAKGKEIFGQKCAPCHGPAGGGTVGPNLTDDYWLHGGSIKDVFKTIKYGVQEKGMIAWQATLKPQEIQQVASFIKSIKGSNPENPKEPQGELFKE